MPKISLFVFLLELQIGSNADLHLEGLTSLMAFLGDGTVNV